MEKLRSCLAVFLLISAVVLLFVSLYLPPEGIIDSSVLNALAQIELLVGSLLGLNEFVTYKIEKLKQDGNKNY